jgi:hypothetical protein
MPLPDNRAAGEALWQAEDVLEKAEGDVLARTRLWCDIANLRHNLGDRAGATEALRKARAIAESQPAAPVQEWRQIAQTYGRLGDARAILELAKVIPEKLENWRGSPRQTVLWEGSGAAESAGHIKAAEEIADAIADETERERKRESIRRSAIISRAKAGDAAAVMKLIEELPTAEDKVFVLVGRSELALMYDDIPSHADGVAQARLLTGDAAGAKEMAAKALVLLQDIAPNRRGTAALSAVRMFARLDDASSARKALAAIPAPDRKATGRAAEYGRVAELIAKGYVAIAEVRAGRDVAAAEFVKDFKRPGEQAYLLHSIALAQARAGRKDESKASFLRAIELVADNEDGVRTTLHNIASAQALAGDFAGAVRTAERLEGSPVTWANIALAQAEAGEFLGARQIAADHIVESSRFWYIVVLKAVARQQARAGQAAALREWAGKLDDRLEHAHVLVGLAEGLFREPEQAPAKR